MQSYNSSVICVGFCRPEPIVTAAHNRNESSAGKSAACRSRIRFFLQYIAYLSELYVKYGVSDIRRRKFSERTKLGFLFMAPLKTVRPERADSIAASVGKIKSKPRKTTGSSSRRKRIRKLPEWRKV